MSGTIWNPGGGTVPIADASPTILEKLFTATAGQTSFVLTDFEYVPGTFTLHVYINGVKQRVSVDYIETNTTTFTLTQAAEEDDSVVALAYTSIHVNVDTALVLAQLASGLGATLVNYQLNYAGTTLRSLFAKADEIVSVKDFGAVGDGITDDYAAIVAAYNRIPASGGILLFPEGDYAFGTALVFGNVKPLVIAGRGVFATRLRPTFAAGDALTINGPGFAQVKDLSFIPTIDRNQNTYDLRIVNAGTCYLSQLYFANTLGGCLFLDNCNTVVLSDVSGFSYNGATGDTCAKLKASSGTYKNITFRAGGAGGYSRGPCLWLTGSATAIQFSNCKFAGCGPRYKFSTAGGNSTGANFTINIAGHNFKVGDFIVFRGVTPVAYNNLFVVAAISTGVSVTVTSTLNPGAVTINGTAEMISASAYVSNEDGPVNESVTLGCIFEALQPNQYGVGGLYFDGRKGTSSLEGWILDGNYYDSGSSGLIIHGGPASGSNDPTTYGFVIGISSYESQTRCILIKSAAGITIAGMICNSSQTITADALSTVAAAIHIMGATDAITQGISIVGGNIGQTRSWFNGFLTRAYDAGILLDGPTIQDLTITGCNIFGKSFAVGDVNGALVAGSRWNIKNNQQTEVTMGANLIKSFASAANLSIDPYRDIVRITGAVNIQNISPIWAGKEVSLLFSGAPTLITGGNLALAANYAVLAGQLVKIISYDGTSWFAK